MTRYGGRYIGKLDEVAKYIFIARELWTPVPYHITINMDVWNRFSKSTQSKIEAASLEARNKFRSEYSKWFEWYLNDQKNRGCTIVFADNSDIEFWTGMPEVDRIKEQWIAEWYSNLEVSKLLFISLKKLRYINKTFRKKLNISGTAQLTKYAIRKVLIKIEFLLDIIKHVT